MGADTVSAFLAETVSGGTLAACVPPEGYFKIIRQICDHYQVLLILDEVMCGMGRTGRWFACQHHEIVPDIVTLGKGLSGGSMALSAVGVRSNHFNMIRDKNAAFIHGGTFSHHPVAAAAGLATIHILEEEQLVDRVARLGHILGDLLKDRLAHHPHVADVRGIGFMWGVEIVEDKRTNRPFSRQEKVTERLWEVLFQEGILVYKSTGLAGTDGDALIIAPPFVITENEMALVADRIKMALDIVFR
jgi:adenosylmethionine-8-amino-7-oxononanoate aminotransferase